MYLVSCTNTHCDIIGSVNHGIVKTTKTWISREQNIIFLQNKKILNLYLRWHVLRSHCFVAEIIFKQTCRLLAAGLFKHWMTLKKPRRTWYFCYSKNANKINVHTCKNQNIPTGYLPAQGQQWTRCVICSKLTKKNNLTDMKTLWNIDIAMVSLFLTLKRFHTFS